MLLCPLPVELELKWRRECGNHLNTNSRGYAEFQRKCFASGLAERREQVCSIERGWIETSGSLKWCGNEPYRRVLNLC